LLAATRVIAADISPACESFNRHALSLLAQNRVTEAQTQLSQFTAQLDAASSENDKLCLGVTLHNLTSTLQDLGQLDAADQAVSRSVRLLEEILGPTAPEIRRPLQLTASIAIQKGQWDRAATLLARAESLKAQSRSDIAMTTTLRGKLLMQAGKLADAERVYRQALSERELAGEGASPFIQDALSSLAILYLKQGRAAEALPLLERSLKISELFPAHPESHTTALFNLAIAYSAHHEEKAAASCFRLAIDSLSNLPATSRPNAGRTVYLAYAKFLQKSGRKREAKALAQEARNLFGPDPATYTVGMEALRAGR
jgi:tetratricopeptide (TPR) repeat protein